MKLMSHIITIKNKNESCELHYKKDILYGELPNNVIKK